MVLTRIVAQTGYGASGNRMVALRTNIERSLDNLASNEGGMIFQGLAVVLAKQRWQDLIACERKKDLGAITVGAD